MNVAISVDRTSSGKEHFEVLDGLRGTAAFLIVLFHVFNYPFGFRPPLHLMHHAYLAVDFFFGLSGFVVAYAYDDRWTRMTMLQFFRIRLIRLHPLLLIVATLGLLGYIFDPFSKAMNHTAAPMLLLAYIASLLLLPSPPVGGRLHETQALNGPAWSLMQEYLANIAYALILRRLRTITLAIIFGLSGLLLIWTANTKGSLDGGWGYPEIWMAPLRLTVSFVMGLWLYRIHDRIRFPEIGLLLLSIVLVVCFQMPQFSKVSGLSLNGLYDAAYYGIKRSSSMKPVTANHRAERPLENTMGRTSKRTRCSAGRILLLVLALTVSIFAQQQSTSAIWRGLVKNSAGTPMVGAKVQLKGTSTAESTTAADGSFSLAALPAGKYN